MAVSQNGWPLVLDNAAGRQKLVDLILPGGMDHHIYVLDGDVATVFRWLTSEYNRRVEPIDSDGCWGWNVRKIGNSDDWSNHSSATAVDINAPDNPDGAPPSKVMTPAQIAECHALERASDNVLRWGGDWSDPDPMHWEIIGDPAEVAVFARKLRKEETMDKAQRTELIQELLNWDLGKPGGKDTVAIALQSGLFDGKEALKRVTALETKLDEVLALLKAGGQA